MMSLNTDILCISYWSNWWLQSEQWLHGSGVRAVILLPEGWQFDQSLPHSECRSVLGQDIETQIAPSYREKLHIDALYEYV